MSYKSAHISKWVSAALGAALLATGLVTGLSAANAAAGGGFAGILTPGTIGGSGTIDYSFPQKLTNVYTDSRCAPFSSTPTLPSDLSAVVTIGGKVYTSPLVSQWPTQTATVPITGCFGPAPAGQPVGQYFPDAVGTQTYTWFAWSMNYSCRAAGTPVIISDSISGGGYTTSVPANGTLPASCLSAPVPTITGTAKVGSTLTATPGTWGPAPVALTYQWKANGVAITGATSATYKLAGAQAGKTITVTVTGTKAGYTAASKTSAATATIAPGTLGPAPVPTITGTAKVSSTLTAVPGTWGPGSVALAYQWKANGVSITGATAATYKLAGAQAGKTVTVTVTGTKTGYTTKSKTSAATAVVAPGTLGPAPVPTITGTAKVGSTLTAVPGTWGPAPVSLTYQWKANGVSITGATAAAYKLAAAQAGKTVTVTVTGTKTGYTTKSKTSAATIKIV